MGSRRTASECWVVRKVSDVSCVDAKTNSVLAARPRALSLKCLGDSWLQLDSSKRFLVNRYGPALEMTGTPAIPEIALAGTSSSLT